MSPPSPAKVDPVPAAGLSTRWLGGAVALRLAGLFLTVCGARLCIVHAYGVDTPFWDQWEAEGGLLFKPWLEGHWQWTSLFAAHLEHRIVFSRLLALALFWANRQWDPLLEMTANLVIAGIVAVAIAGTVWRGFNPAHRDVLLVAAALVFSLPYGWENILGGFQSCFYLLLLFSLIAIWGLVGSPPGSRAWWTGALFSLAACFTLGSGSFAAMAVLALLALRCICRRLRVTRAEIITGLWCVAVVGLGVTIKSDVPAHAILRAESVLSFAKAFGACLAWPFILQPLFAPVFYAPLGLLAWFYLRRSNVFATPVRQRWELVLATGIWVLLQGAASAFARGAHGLPPASRYQEIFGVGSLINLAAVLLLVDASRRRAVVSAVATLWIALGLVGLGELTRQKFAGDLPAKADLSRQEEDNTCAYVATGDQRFLVNHPLFTIPFPNAEQLILWLDDPTLRAILPAGIRPRLTMEKAEGSPEVFVPAGYYPTVVNPAYLRSWGSFSSLGNAARGTMAGTPIDCPLPYLELQFSGYLGERGDLSFGWRDLQSQRFTAFHPSKSAREHWRTEYVGAPAGKFRLEATDGDPDFWFAFREPVAVGRLSYYAGYLLRHGVPILFTGASLLLMALLQTRLNEPEAPRR